MWRNLVVSILISQILNDDGAIFALSGENQKKCNKTGAKFELNFPVLSDENLELASSYGVQTMIKIWTKFYSNTITSMATIVLDSAGSLIFSSWQPGNKNYSKSPFPIHVYLFLIASDRPRPNHVMTRIDIEMERRKYADLIDVLRSHAFFS